LAWGRYGQPASVSSQSAYLSQGRRSLRVEKLTRGRWEVGKVCLSVGEKTLAGYSLLEKFIFDALRPEIVLPTFDTDS
jgi:hypothetical protein